MKDRKLKYKNMMTVLFAAMFFLLGTSAYAQYQGDVFFKTPSVLISKDQVKDLDLTIYTGDKPFGAATAQIQFDPQKIEVVKVEPVASSDVLPVIEWKMTNGTVKIAAVNGASLTEPFGSVVLARISVRAVGNPGDQTSVSSAVNEAYGADKSAYRKGDGLSAEISIGTAVAATLSVEAVDDMLRARALKLRPAGGRVKLYLPSGAGTFREVVVPTADPDMAKETTVSPAKL
jgi:hypothetical protein